MANLEEPPSKRQCTNYELCLLCQSEKDEVLVDIHHAHFKCESYDKVITKLHMRANFGNIKYVTASQRLYGIASDVLKKQNASWHSTCYKLLTNRAHILRDEKFRDKILATKDISSITNRKRGRPSADTIAASTPPLKHTRSKCKIFIRDQCFFCQTVTNEVLHACSTASRSSKISQIVANSGNDLWKVQLGDVLTSNDLLSKDVMYHHRCYTTHWAQFVQRVTRRSSDQEDCPIVCEGSTETGLVLIAAEVDFLCILQDKVDANEYMTIPEIEELYSNILNHYDIVDVESVTHEQLKEKIIANIENVTITKSTGRKPSLVHSNDAGAAAIRRAACEDRNVHGKFKQLLKCGTIIRQAVKQTLQAPWKFNGSLRDNIGAGIPQELLSLVRWIIQGTAEPKTEIRTTEILNSCILISQHIMQQFKSDKQVKLMPVSPSSLFRSTTETPLSVGLSLHSYHSHRSKKDISLLHHCGIGISYQHVSDITTHIASTVQDNMTNFNGVYVPPRLLKNVPIRCSADNIDAKVDTADGRNTFHGTALAVYQRVPPDASQYETVSEQITFGGNHAGVLQNVPSTVSEMSTCTIMGTPKPDTSPCYETFRLGQYQGQVLTAQTNDIMWLLARYYERLLPVGSLKSVPIWSAYNSLLCTTSNKDKRHRDRDHSLPIINAPAHEWRTLLTSLTQLHRLNSIVCPDDAGKVLITLDMDLYKRALKIEYLDKQYAGKWMLCPGAFHTVLCALRCLGKTIEHSGLDDAWSKDLYSSVTVNQLLNGSHHNRAIEAHEITLEVFFQLWFAEFLKENPVTLQAVQSSANKLVKACQLRVGIAEAQQQLLVEIEQLNLMKQLQDFDNRHDQFPMFKWARMYMRQVMALLNFTRSNKDPDILLHIAALENLCKYFFSYNRLDYAQNISEYIARVSHTHDVDPSTWKRFMSGDFALTTSNVAFTGTGIDQGQEFLNKILKGDGGLRGITNKPATLLKYCLCAPELARLAKETEEMLGLPTKSRTVHHHLSTAKSSQRERNVIKLASVIEQCNPFADKSPRLYNLMSKVVMPEHIEKDILTMEERGQQAFQSFVEQRICGSTNLWDRMTKQKFLSWADSCKTIKLKGSSGQMQMKATNSLFARLLMIAKSNRQIDLEDVISNHEFTHINNTLMNSDGSLIATTNKSDLIHILENMDVPEIDAEAAGIVEGLNNTYLIIDGMSLVHELMSVIKFSTCKGLAEVFMDTIAARCQSYAGGRVIFDNYQKQNCIKELMRNHQSGMARSTKSFTIVDTTPIKMDAKVFLANRETKDSLTLYLADKILQLQISIVSVTRCGVRSNYLLSPTVTGISTHEEADTLMMLHAREICADGHNVHIMTQDTDVLVLSLRRFPDFNSQTCIIMGTSEHRRKIFLKSIYDALGPDKASALLGFHALTGCDTCGHIRGKGKKTAFKIFMSSSEDVVSALMQLGMEDRPSADVVSGCEKFLCRLMCTKSETADTAGALRWKRFKTLPPEHGIDKIPPTSGAWYQHILRAHMQAVIWRQDLVLEPLIPDPCQFGWTRAEDGNMVPFLSAVQTAPASVVELVRCGCSVSKCATQRCTCRQNNLTCTEMCNCEVDEECCNVECIDREEVDMNDSD